MIRWRYLIPRVLILLLVLLVISSLLPPLVRRATVTVGQAVFRAKVEVGSVDVGLFPPRLRYREVQVANPGRDRQMRNLVSAEAVDLVVDVSALLRRRYVINEARIAGLEFDSRRLTSGHLEKKPKPTSSEPSRAAVWISGLLNGAGDAAKRQLDELAANSHSRRRGEEIRKRWQGEYDALTKRASDLESAIQEVLETAKGIENPLRDWPRVDSTLTKAREIQRELVEVRKRLDEMPLQIQADMLSMEQAKQADLQRLRDLVPSSRDDGESLGPGLLLAAIRDHLDTVRQYMDTGRDVSRLTVASPKVARRRGRLIDLERGPAQPSVLVRRCEIAGVLSSGGRPYRLAGVVENLTPQPHLRPQPLRARLRLDGDQTARVDYVRDDSEDTAREILTVHWPEAKAPTLRLGTADSVDLNVRDGRTELWVHLRSAGDQIDGRFVSRRIDTRIELTASDKVAATPLFTTLRDRLAAVDRIEVDARISGSWEAPRVALSTNLSGAFDAALREAVAAQVAQTQAAMQAEIDRVHARQLAQLQRWLADQQGGANAMLAKADATVQQISQRVISETNKADAYFGRLRGKVVAPSLR